MEHKQNSEFLLIPEVITRINSYDASDELKDDFKEILRLAEPRYQIINLKIMEKRYQEILQFLVKTLDRKLTTFSCIIRGCCHKPYFKIEKDVLKWFKENDEYDSHICDCFMKEMTKIDMYKNVKLVAVKCGGLAVPADYPVYWNVYITCDIEYR